MVKMLIVPTATAMLPEISVYQSHFQKYNISVTVLDDENKKEASKEDYDILWEFMGLRYKNVYKARIRVHEYQSLSVPPLAKFKNGIKRAINSTPSFRVFQNKYISDEMRFRDNIVSFYRPMGVEKHFFDDYIPDYEYDFVYSGAIDNGRNVIKVIRELADLFPQKKFLMIGTDSDELKKRIPSLNNVHGVGKVPYSEMPKYLRKAEYGLNLVPDTYPYSTQMSTKLLEYCAVGLKVITFPTRDAISLAKKYGGNFYILQTGSTSRVSDGLSKFNFKVPDIAPLCWDVIMTDFIKQLKEHKIL